MSGPGDKVCAPDHAQRTGAELTSAANGWESNSRQEVDDDECERFRRQPRCHRPESR